MTENNLVATSDWVVRRIISNDITYKVTPAYQETTRCVNIMKKSLSGKENSLCSGPDRKKPRIARIQWARKGGYKKSKRQAGPTLEVTYQSCILKNLAQHIIQKALKVSSLAHPPMIPCISLFIYATRHAYIHPCIY